MQSVTVTPDAFPAVTVQFSGPGRAIGTLCVCSYDTYLLT